MRFHFFHFISVPFFLHLAPFSLLRQPHQPTSQVPLTAIDIDVATCRRIDVRSLEFFFGNFFSWAKLNVVTKALPLFLSFRAFCCLVEMLSMSELLGISKYSPPNLMLTALSYTPTLLHLRFQGKSCCQGWHSFFEQWSSSNNTLSQALCSSILSTFCRDSRTL